MNQLDHHQLKLKKILKICQIIKDQYNIDVKNSFGIYSYNDDKIDYKENLCHAIVRNCCENSLKQCSKQRSKNDNDKKKSFYCQQHYKNASTGDLDMCIISPEIFKRLDKNVIPTESVSSSMQIIPPQPQSKFLKNLRCININGNTYYVNQRNHTVYDMDMIKVGKYAYDSENDQHIICDE